MPRVKPMKTLDVLGPLSISPEKSPDFFIESKKHEKFYVKPPNWDSLGDSIELMACLNDREHKVMLQLQEEMRYDADHQHVINGIRTRELYKMQKHLRERFIEANNFFKDCNDKKIMAEAIVAEEKRHHVQMKESIKENKTNIITLTELKLALEKIVGELEPYERVIHQAIRESDIWTSVKDCTDRCDALMMAQVEICEMKRDKMNQIAEMRLKIQNLTSEAALTVLGLNNELAELERAYTQAKMNCYKWEKIIGNSKDAILTYKLQTNQMLDEMQIMYRMLCKRRAINPVLRRCDVEAMMDFIRDEIEILQAVVKECTAKPTKITKRRR